MLYFKITPNGKKKQKKENRNNIKLGKNVIIIGC